MAEASRYAAARRQRLRRHVTTGALLICVPPLTPTNPLRAERALLLEVWINGRATGLVAEFKERDGAIFAAASELKEIGLAVPEPAADAEAVPLAALSGVSFRLEEASQRLAITADLSSLRAATLAARAAEETPKPVAESRLGMVLNYDLLGSYDLSGQALGSAFLDFRATPGRFGALSSAAVLRSAALGPDQESVVRLETSWTYSEPDELRRWRVGDAVSGGLSWTRPVRLGGFQLQTDFALRPDLVTYPVPVLAGEAAVPSALDVLLNGSRYLSQQVNEGPFVLQRLPAVNGAGEVTFAMRDALGRETVTTLPFYSSSTMMAPGLLSYSAEFGAVRQGYGLRSADYGDWAASGSLRYGVSDWLTLEGHSELAGALHLGGVGGTLRVGSLGTVSASVAASGGEASGLSSSIGIERQSRRFRFGVLATAATPDFRDIAALQGVPVPRSSLRASLGLSLGPYGSVGLAYAMRDEGDRTPFRTTGHGATQILTASYNIALADNVYLYANGIASRSERDSYGAMVGISISLGTTTAGGSVSLDGGRRNYQAQASRAATTIGDLGLRTYASEGAIAHRIAEGEYLASWGRMSAGVEQFSGTGSARLGARGALVVTGEGLYPSDSVPDSYAVVDTGGVADVGILHENRLVGRTDAKGRLLVPYLRSYQANKLTVDTADLPLDVQAGQSQVEVRPSERSGVRVNFDIHRDNAALVRLQARSGHPLPLGATATLPGGEATPVGHGGEAFLMGLQPTNQLRVTLPGGGSCEARFAYQPVAGELPVIGPVVCQ